MRATARRKRPRKPLGPRPVRSWSGSGPLWLSLRRRRLRLRLQRQLRRRDHQQRQASPPQPSLQRLQRLQLRLQPSRAGSRLQSCLLLRRRQQQLAARLRQWRLRPQCLCLHLHLLQRTLGLLDAAPPAVAPLLQALQALLMQPIPRPLQQRLPVPQLTM